MKYTIKQLEEAAREAMFIHVMEYYRDNDNEEPVERDLILFSGDNLEKHGFEVTDEGMNWMYEEYTSANASMLGGLKLIGPSVS